MRYNLTKGFPSVLLCLLAFSFSFPAISSVCQTSQNQNEAIDKVIENHKETVSEVVKNIVKKPKPAREEACLDGLLNMNLDVFAVNPTSVYKDAFKKIRDELVNQACNATSDSWNDAVRGATQDLEIPYDLGGISITATKGDWGNQTKESLQMPDSEIAAFSESISNISNVNQDIIETDVSGLSGNLSPPSWESTNKEIGDDLQDAMQDMFF